MNPELKKLIDRYVAAGATDDEILQMAAEWKRQHEVATSETSGAAIDPDLKRLLDQYTAQHPDATDDQLKQIVEAWGRQSRSTVPEPAPSPITAQDVLNSAYQGLTLGWGDELAGLLSGDAARDEIRRRDEAFHKAHPTADLVTKLAAGAVPFLAGGAEAKGAGVFYNMLRGARIGATTGAISGAGEGTDFESRLRSGAFGGVLGGALGAAIPGTVSLVKQVAPRSVAMQELAAAAAKSGGVGKLRQSLANIATANRGDDVLLGDLAPQLASKADFAANNSEDAFNAFVKKLGQRQKGASDRLQQDAVELLGGEPNAEQFTDQLVQNRRAWANDAYSSLALDAEIPPKTLKETLGGAFKQPSVKSAIKQARLAGDLDPSTPLGATMADLQIPEGMTLQQAVQAGILEPGGEGGVTVAGATPAKRKLTWDDLHQLKQIFDDRATSAFTSGKGALGRSYSTLRDAVEGALNDHVEGYEQVTGRYKNLMDLERAVAAGSKMWDKVDSRGLATEIAKLSPGELSSYRIGLASRMIAKLQNVATNRNEAGAYVNASNNLQNKLRTVFGDEATFQEFMRRAAVEDQFNALKGVVGNSATYRRQAAAGSDPLDMFIDVVRAGALGGPKYAGLTALRRGVFGMNKRRIADALAPLLAAEGETNVGRALDRIEAYNPSLNNVFGTLAPSLAGRASGLFGSVLPQ